ncbi:DUF3038 domain-containing protein [Synechocystis sp. LKSZ1]|uniref:DUF3038 domain-containing protein n=1 Tax=Synechocystis sp. LKSZ1 TaxID=3144951 RepID=UPI00336BC178
MVNSNNGLELPLVITADAHQLPLIQGYLQGLLLSLWALTELEESSWNQASQALALDGLPPLSRYLGPAEPGATSAFSFEEARSLVLIVAKLAQQHQEILRRAVTLLEQMQEQGKDPSKTALLGTYLEKFEVRYQDQCQRLGLPSPARPQAFKFLVDLLFCSNPYGPRWLWSALITKT